MVVDISANKNWIFDLFFVLKVLTYFHNLDIILQHSVRISDIDVEIIGDIICPTSEEDSCTWFFASTAC